MFLMMFLMKLGKWLWNLGRKYLLKDVVVKRYYKDYMEHGYLPDARYWRGDEPPELAINIRKRVPDGQIGIMYYGDRIPRFHKIPLIRKVYKYYEIDWELVN